MKNKNFPLIVGISLPVVFIVAIAIVVFAPSLFVKPQHNFIYTTEDNNYSYTYTYKNTYTVANNRIAIEPLIIPTNPYRKPNLPLKEAPDLYLYDINTESSHKITLDEAEDYLVDPGPSSPDGYTVVYKYENGGFIDLFGSGSGGSYFFTKGNGSKKVNGLNNSDRYWNSSFKIIGWVK